MEGKRILKLFQLNTFFLILKDEVALELNKAVLHSYKKAGVSIVDHFTQADQFMEHMREETKVRGGCPADWVWIVPPQSGSLVSTFHQEMLNYHLSPSYEYQDKPYETWFRGEKMKTFRSVAKCVQLLMSLYMKMVKKRKVCTVFYSSETGTAKKYAKMAAEMFTRSYKTQIVALDKDLMTLRQENEKADIEILIASTFGNGEAPEMSRDFAAALDDLVQDHQIKIMAGSNNNESDSKSIHFSVFGLGSTAYPKFAQFGSHLHSSYTKLGETPILPYTAGDELKDQQGTFRKWLKKVFFESLAIMEIEPPRSVVESFQSCSSYKWRLSAKHKNKTSKTALKEFFGQPVESYRMVKRTNLHMDLKEPSTLKIDFNYTDDSDQWYEPGDHLCIFPYNSKRNVEYLKSRLNNNPPSDRLVTLQCESSGLWENVDDFPAEVSFDDLLTYFLDIMKVPTQQLLELLSAYAEDKFEKEELGLLANDDVIYEKWKLDQKVCSNECAIYSIWLFVVLA